VATMEGMMVVEMMATTVETMVVRACFGDSI
jgi:hypothetical protein